MFCGGGGESTGLIEAAHEFNFDINMSAINHWERAIETHSQNYPFAEHRCENEQQYKNKIAELEAEIQQLKSKETKKIRNTRYGLNWIDVPEALEKLK